MVMMAKNSMIINLVLIASEAERGAVLIHLNCLYLKLFCQLPSIKAIFGLSPYI